MALTRDFLTALGIEKEKHQAIIDAHTETTDALKAERDRYKADADRLPKALEDLKKAQEAAKDSGKYDALKKEYDDYKASVADKETLAAKKAALEKLCRAKDGAHLSEEGVAKALKYADYGAIELDEKNEIKNAKGLVKTLREEWKEHALTESSQGARTPNPPAGDGGANDYSYIRKLTDGWNAAKYGAPVQPQQGGNSGTT